MATTTEEWQKQAKAHEDVHEESLESEEQSSSSGGDDTSDSSLDEVIKDQITHNFYGMLISW